MKTVKPADDDDDEDGNQTPVAGGGGPPYDGNMERRLTVLEARFDAILPTLATKADVDALRVEMHRSLAELHKSIAELHKSIADLHKSNADLHKSNAEQHKSIAGLHQSIAGIHKSIADAHKWIIGTMIALFVGLSGLIVSLDRSGVTAALPARSPEPTIGHSPSTPTPQVPAAQPPGTP